MVDRDPRPRVRIRPPDGLERYMPEYLRLTRDDVEAAIAARSLAAWKILGHNLRGSAASFGLPDVEAFGQAIENHARRGSAEQALECALALREYLECVEIEEI